MNPSTDAKQSSSLLTGIVLGGLIGLVISTFLVGVLGFVWVKKKEADVRRGWNLVPIVVASQDIKEGTVVTFEMINQRSVPEQFVTSSVVKPDSATYIVDQRVLVDVQAGDPLLWSQFDPKKQTPGLVAARDIPVGATLAAEDVEVRSMATHIVTPSYVKDAERPQVVGRSVIAAFRKGDPILWTHFQAAPPPVAP